MEKVENMKHSTFGAIKEQLWKIETTLGTNVRDLEDLAERIYGIGSHSDQTDRQEEIPQPAAELQQVGYIFESIIRQLNRLEDVRVRLSEIA